MSTRLCVSFFVFLLAARAQTVSGTFVGQVTDNSQATVPAAAVEFTDIQHGAVKKTVTGSDGNYTLPYMQPGDYTVRISAPGFKIFERPGIALTLGASVRVNARLELGYVSESVTVSQSQPLLQTERSE